MPPLKRRLLILTVVCCFSVSFVNYLFLKRTSKSTISSSIWLQKTVIKNFIFDDTNVFNKTIRRYDFELKGLTITRGLIVDWWFDICLRSDLRGSTWHPLVPRFPQRTDILTFLSDQKALTGTTLRRIYGFVSVESTGEYEIHLQAKGEAELLLLEEILENNSSVNATSFIEIAYLNTKGGISVEKITLSKNKTYFIEVFHFGRPGDSVHVKWRRTNEPFRTIGLESIFHTKTLYARTVSALRQKHYHVMKYQPTSIENRRTMFYNVPNLFLEEKINKPQKLKCDVTGLSPVELKKLYDGIYRMDNIHVYPKEYFDFTDRMPPHKLMLPEAEAVRVAEKTFEAINTLYNGDLQLADIVHMHTNFDYKFKRYNAWKGAYYFVELDVRRGPDRMYRTTNFVRKDGERLCFMDDYKWRNNVTINLITPLKDQRLWLEFLLRQLEKVMQMTGDNNLNLILIDYDSTDGDIQAILDTTPVSYQYLKVKGRQFNKVRALNRGLKKVEDENSIVFVMDLHLELPINIFDRIRKLTIEGKTAYSPTLMSFKTPCEHEQYTPLTKLTVWQDDGPGMMAMYKSDWQSIGGFNEKLYGETWGGEDWEVVDRIMKHGLQLIHYRLPRFYHLYHPRKKMWNKARR